MIEGAGTSLPKEMQLMATPMTISPAKGKNKATQVEPNWAEDLDPIVPAVMKAEFARMHAADILQFLFIQSANNASVAIWLARNIFGEGGWAADLCADSTAFTGMATNPKDYARAKTRATDAFVTGGINAPALGMILTALADREAAAAHATKNKE